MSSLLLVEDDERISRPLVLLLETEGFDVHHVDRGADVVATVAAIRPDVVVLDLGLPDVDGLDVCRDLRAAQPDLAIVMLTARSEEVDVIVGLGAGADDYIAKPFRVGELVARINARVRQRPESDRDPQDRKLHLDVAARRAWDDGRELTLTPKEFNLLAHLVGHPGVVLRREQIMTDVWDEHWWGPTRTLDTHIAALRRKLGDTSDPPSRITTIRGVGFRYEAE